MDLERLPKLGMIGTAFPRLLQLARQLPVPYFQDALQSGKRISAYAEQSLVSYRESITREPSLAKPTLFTRLLRASDSADALSDIDLTSEARGYIVGGSDNTAVSLTYLVWAVCRNVEIRQTLLRELETLPMDFGDEELRKLPFLGQVVKETLRLYASNPSNRPRNAPAPGAYLCGYWVPEEVTVSTQAYSLHRDKEIFPDPER
jgi:cytochrome P450